MPSERPTPTSDQKHSQLVKALRESEILRELAELLASSLDPTRILQVLVKRTTEVCDVERCAVWLLDDSRTRYLPCDYHISAPHLKPEHVQAAAQTWQHSSLPFNNPVLLRLLEEGGLLTLPDLRTEPSMRAIAEKFFVRSILLVALLREGRPVGMISLDNPGTKRTFSQEQRQLARAIGQQAAVAIDNARLYQQAQEERNRAERLIVRAQSIYQVAMAVNSDKELSEVLEIAAQHLVHGLNADGATMALVEGEALAIVRNTRLHPLHLDMTEAHVIPCLNDLPHCLAAAKQGKPLFVLTEQTEGIERHWYHQLGLENVMIVPLIAGPSSRLRLDPGRGFAHTPPNIVGFAFITYQQSYRQPSLGQYAFAQDIAAQCALAIDKANLFTEARKAAALATERANTLDAVFNAMTEGIIVLDLEGNVIISNSTAMHFMGVSRDRQLHLHSYLQDHAIYTLQGQSIPPQDFALSRALQGEHVWGERFITRRADDSERLVEVNVAPLFDSEGAKIGVVGAFRDISEQVRVEQRIRRALDTMLHAAEAVSGITDSREMLRSVLQMTLNALNSERGVVQLYHQEQRTFTPLLSIGFSQEEEEQWLAEQKHWLEPTDEQYTGFYTQLLAGHATLVSAEQCPDQSDVFHQTMILASPITHNGQLLGVMMLDRSSTLRKARIHPQDIGATRPLPRRDFSIWDIAVVEGIAQFAGLAIEQARWQQEAEIARTNEAMMRESNKLKDEFLAITAHEFRTPLTIILGYSQMIARTLKKIGDVQPEIREKLQESIGNIETQSHHLTNIVNTFLEVTRLNRGQIVLTLKEVDLEEVVKEAVNMQNTTAKEHHIKYSIKKGKCSYRVEADKARLLQIFTNLLQNAIKYSPPGSPITVSLQQCCTSEGKWYGEVRVRDKGIGIPKDAQARLFERFYRAPNIESSRARGVGLGLYVVAELLRLHGGDIRVESSGVMGEGSCFIFTLPLAESTEHE